MVLALIMEISGVFRNSEGMVLNNWSQWVLTREHRSNLGGIFIHNSLADCWLTREYREKCLLRVWFYSLIEYYYSLKGTMREVFLSWYGPIELVSVFMRNLERKVFQQVWSAEVNEWETEIKMCYLTIVWGKGLPFGWSVPLLHQGLKIDPSVVIFSCWVSPLLLR